MTNGQQLEFGVQPVRVSETEIIRAIPQTAKKRVDLTLQKVELPLSIPPSITPLPDPIDTISPLPFAPVVQARPGVRGLILNIETSGFDPLRSKLIAIGVQDPEFPNELPTVIMRDSEAEMINILFSIINSQGFNQLIGYGLSFDYKFLFLKACKFGINARQFVDMELNDQMQVAAQVIQKFVYNAQRPPKLSDLADWLWSYPKPFTDLEMIKFWASGQPEKVIEFTSSQITRILLVYSLFRSIKENPFIAAAPGVESSRHEPNNPSVETQSSKLTIPEANAPKTWKAKCPISLEEADVPMDQATYQCKFEPTIIQRPT